MLKTIPRLKVRLLDKQTEIKQSRQNRQRKQLRNNPNTILELDIARNV